MHGLLRCNINTGVHAGAHGADVSLRDVTIAQLGNRGYRVRMTSRTRSVRKIWGFLKKVSRVETCLRVRRLAFACSPKPGQWPWWQVPHEMGGRWKSQNRKNVYLSSYVEEPLNSKVIKSFIPELRSRKCFSCFEIPMFSVIYIYEHYMSISRYIIF